MRVSDFNKIVQGNDQDLARNNLYSIEVYMPRGHPHISAGAEFGNFYTDSDSPEIQEKLSYMAKTVTLPGKSIGTIDAKRFGPVYKVANDLIVDTVSMTFMCSADYTEHKFFDGWISGIMGQIKNPKSRQVYTLSYYYDYVGQVNIIPLDRQGGAAAQVTLMEAYPTNVGPIEFAWGDTGEIANFTVTWSFKDWNHTQTAGWSADTDGKDGNFMFDYLMQESRPAAATTFSKDVHYQGGKSLGQNKIAPGESTEGFRDSPGGDGSRVNVYKQGSADGTKITTVPHKTRLAPGHDGSLVKGIDDVQ